MNPAEWKRKLAKMLAVDKLAREQPAKPPVPRAPSNIATPPNTEQLLQLEQLELAGVIDDAVALLTKRPSEAAKAALWQRAEKLSPSALMTAKVLIRARLDGRVRKRPSNGRSGAPG